MFNSFGFKHFESCNDPSLVIQNKGVSQTQYFNTDFICEAADPLPDLGEIDDFIDKLDKHQKNDFVPGTRINLIKEIKSRLNFITRANIKKLELQQKCFKGDQSSQCQEITKNIKNGIKDNWDDMSIGLVLGFQKNSAIRYQFGSEKPDLFQFKKTKHPFGGEVKISEQMRENAQKDFDQISKSFAPTVDSHMREYIQQSYKEKYTNALNNAPLMAMVDSKHPSNKEISKGLELMIENNKKILEHDFDAEELIGFYPLIQTIVKDDPQYCRFAEHWVDEKLKKEKNNRYLKLGAAAALGAGCFASAWTGVGLSLCFASGALMTGVNVVQAKKSKEFERMKAFNSAVDNQLVKDFDALSSAEQDYALEVMMAPLAGFGAGSFVKSIAPSTKLLSFLNNAKSVSTLKNSEESLESLSKMSSTSKALQDDVAKVRGQYKNAQEVQVCGMNIGEYMCRDNIQELLKYAHTKYPGFDISKAKVIRIDAPEYIPLYANKATKPQGYSSTSKNGVKDFSKKTRDAKDGATTWSRHYVLEYEGRIFDFDHASDVAPVTKDYFETMFKDTFSGVVKNEARSKYLVREIDAEEYMNSEAISIYDIRSANHSDQSYFFDYYKELPGADTSIKVPKIHPDIQDYTSN